MGELPPIESWPHLCVEDDDYAEAKRIVAEALSVKEMTPWRCDSWGEEIEGQFIETHLHFSYSAYENILLEIAEPD